RLEDEGRLDTRLATGFRKSRLEASQSAGRAHIGHTGIGPGEGFLASESHRRLRPRTGDDRHDRDDPGGSERRRAKTRYVHARPLADVIATLLERRFRS